MYNHNRDRRVTELDPTNAPPEATHIATIPSGIKYFVKFDGEGKCWVQPSNQYGTGYAHAGLYMKDVILISLKQALGLINLRLIYREKLSEVSNNLLESVMEFNRDCLTNLYTDLSSIDNRSIKRKISLPQTIIT